MLLNRFFKNKCGGVAPLVAMSIIPLMGAVGAAVDYTRANGARTAFQAALDATALMAAKNAVNESAADLQTEAIQLFQRAVQPSRYRQHSDQGNLHNGRRREAYADRHRRRRYNVHDRARL